MPTCQCGKIAHTGFTLLTDILFCICVVEIPAEVLGLINAPEVLNHLTAYCSSSIDGHHSEEENAIMTQKLLAELLHHEIVFPSGKFIQTEIALDEPSTGALVRHTQEPKGNTSDGYHCTEEKPVPQEDVYPFVQHIHWKGTLSSHVDLSG